MEKINDCKYCEGTGKNKFDTTGKRLCPAPKEETYNTGNWDTLLMSIISFVLGVLIIWKYVL